MPIFVLVGFIIYVVPTLCWATVYFAATLRIIIAETTCSTSGGS